MIESGIFVAVLGVISTYFLGSSTHKPNVADHFGTAAIVVGACLIAFECLAAIL